MHFMNDVIITSPIGFYTSADAIQNVIGYCSHCGKVTIGGYGFYPATYTKAIEMFHIVQESAPHAPERNIWHLIIAFRKNKTASFALSIANQIASLFYSEYLVLYGIHDKRNSSSDRGYHLHFAISSTSYTPNGTELTLDKMIAYITQIGNIMQNQYGLTPLFDGLFKGLQI